MPRLCSTLLYTSLLSSPLFSSPCLASVLLYSPLISSHLSPLLSSHLSPLLSFSSPLIYPLSSPLLSSSFLSSRRLSSSRSTRLCPSGTGMSRIRSQLRRRSCRAPNAGGRAPPAGTGRGGPLWLIETCDFSGGRCRDAWDRRSCHRHRLRHRSPPPPPPTSAVRRRSGHPPSFPASVLSSRRRPAQDPSPGCRPLTYEWLAVAAVTAAVCGGRGAAE